MCPRLTRRRFHDALPWSSSSKQARQAEMDPAFIDEFQVSQDREPFFSEPPLKLVSEASDAGRVPLAIVERLFFRGRCNCCNSRHIVLGLTSTSAILATRAHSSRRVRSGCCLTSARMTAAQSCSARVGPCAGGSGVVLPVSRFRRNHFSTVDRLTSKIVAMAAWVCLPAWAFASTRFRKSRE